MSRVRTGLVAIAVVVTAPIPTAPAGGTAQAASAATTFCGARAATEQPAELPLESYEGINPIRLVDTRDGTGGVDETLGADCTLRLDLAGSVVPVEATAVSLSLTGVADQQGFLTAYPCEAGRPETSNLNVRVGIGTPNLVVGLLDSTRSICVYSNVGSDIVIDLEGWWSQGPDRFSSIDPARAYDTRELPEPVRLPAGHIRDIEIGGLFVPAEATSAVVTLTATDALSQGWLSVFPCGEDPPLASNLNVRTDEARAVSAIVGLGRGGGAEGRICVQSNIETHFVIDVNGYYAPAPQFGPTPGLRPMAGDRVADSRNGTGGWSKPFEADEVRSFNPLLGSPFEDQASTVMLNVIGTNAESRGHLRVYPCSDDVTESSAVNFSTEGAATNLVPVALSAEGKVCIYASQPTDVVVDLFGVMTAPEGSFAERLSFGSTEVWPPFSPDGTDYALRCETGSNKLQINLELLPFVTAKVNGVTKQSGDITETAVTDSLLPITLERNGVTKEYFFRCLPEDFPLLDIDRPGEPTPGWYLTTFGQGTAPSGTFTVILDNRGAPVWYKRTDEALINFQRGAVEGTLRATPLGRFFGIPSDNIQHRISNLQGKLLDLKGEGKPDGSGDINAFPVDHHDFVELPGGGWTTISYPLRTNVDLSDLGAGFFVDDSVVDGAIREFDANGDLVWDWRSDDYFGENESTFPQRFQNYGPPDVRPEGELNPVHINALTRIEDGSNDYLVSARHLDAVFRIDHESKDVRWILGSLPSELGDPPDPDYVENKSLAPRLRIVDDPLGGPLRQHDAQLDGNVLTMFDNRSASGQPSRAVSYLIDDSGDPANWTATLIWQLSEPMGLTSLAQGSVRRAPDGSTLIGWGVMQPMFVEFDALGDPMMTINQLDPATGFPAGASYRIVKYPPTDFDVIELRQTAGGMAEAPPLPPPP